MEIVGIVPSEVPTKTTFEMSDIPGVPGGTAKLADVTFSLRTTYYEVRDEYVVKGADVQVRFENHDGLTRGVTLQALVGPEDVERIVGAILATEGFLVEKMHRQLPLGLVENW